MDANTPTTTRDKLSPTQFKVAELLALGFTCREIAERFKAETGKPISIKTIDTHRAVALRRLGVRSNVALARLAIREGWVSADAALEPIGEVRS